MVNTTRIVLAMLGFVAAMLHAGEPHGVKNCGFDSSAAVANGLARGVAGQIVDCMIFGCVPILSVAGVASAVVEEVDVACAGAVYEGFDEKGRRRATMHSNYDSAASAREAGAAYCDSFYHRCRLILLFRHAAAGYRAGGKIYWAQAADLPTAREIAQMRCQRATGHACALVLEAENRG